MAFSVDFRLHRRCRVDRARRLRTLLLYGEREAWRGEAEIACLNSGAVKERPERVRISAINGPGMCGADYPIRVSALGETGPLGYDDEPLRPPGVASVKRGAAALAGEAHVAAVARPGSQYGRRRCRPQGHPSPAAPPARPDAPPLPATPGAADVALRAGRRRPERG